MEREKGLIILCRHGQTQWSLEGRHTGHTDIELTEEGRKQAVELGKKISQFKVDAVYCSPLKRAVQTCQLAGFESPVLDEHLVEWDYGAYEGLTSQEIHQKDHNWNLFDQGAPKGESVDAVAQRAHTFIEKKLKVPKTVLVFSSAHFSRVLGCLWVGLPACYGKNLILSTGSYSLLSYEHHQPALLKWNVT